MKTFIDTIRAGHRPSIDECVEALGDGLPLLRAFKDTPQDPEWHAEGDVHIHTGMVLEETYRLLDASAEHLSQDRRLLFILGSLLHDIAKPTCTAPQQIKGVSRIAAKGHEAAGRAYLALRLLGQGLSYAELETLLGLVGYHHEPKFAVAKGRGLGAYKRIARLADPELLFWVEQADMRGRICPNRAHAVEQIDLFRMFAEEYGAFVRGGSHAEEWSTRLRESMAKESDAAYDFARAEAQRSLEKGEICSIEEAIARSFAHRFDFPELVIMVGLSGSGKTTFVERYLNGFDVVSLDGLREELGKGRSDQAVNGRVLSEAKDRLKASLRKKRSVVWDATSLRKDFRTRTAGLGFDYGALVTLVVLHCPPTICQARNRNRSEALEANVLRMQGESLQWPELDEAHRVIYLNEDHEVWAAFGVEGQLPYGLVELRR